MPMMADRFNAALAAIGEFGSGDGRLEKGGKPAKVGGATQLHRTASDSRPDSFAGSREEKVDEDEDGISDAGTDYMGKSLREVQLSIADKMEKSGATAVEIKLLKGDDPTPTIRAKLVKAAEAGDYPKLSKAEQWALSFSKGGGSFKPFEASDDDGDEEDKEKKKKEMKKGDERRVIESPLSQQTMDASPHLAALVKAQTIGTQAVLEEVALLKAHTAKLESQLAEERAFAAKARERDTSFRKAASDVLQGIAQQQAATSELLAGLSTGAAGGPRSTLRVLDGGQAAGGGQGHGQVLNRGAAGGDAPDIYAGTLRKSARDVLLDMIKAGEVNPGVIDSFETGSKLDPGIESTVRTKLANRGMRA